MTLRPIWIVAFSGHRPSRASGRSLEELRQCTGRIEQVLSEFRQAAEKLGGEIELLVSAAEGADRLAFEVAETFNCGNLIVAKVHF
jgi:hypothetical protein